jgi:hypothetical protein
MPILQAFLALALSMLSLSTMATVGVEIVNRVLHFRGNDLRRMLKLFYEGELQPIVDTHFELTIAEDIDAKRDEIIAELISNPLVLDPTGWQWSWLRDLTSLSTMDMIKRLPKTAVGQALAERSAAEVDTLLDNAIAKYDQYGKACSDLFGRRSQFISICAGIVVAFSLNVDALFMLQTYVQDPATRQAVISKAESITATWEQVNAGITKQETLDNKQPPGASVPAESPTSNQSDLKQVNANLDQIRKIATDLQDDVGVPLGYRESLPPMTILRPAAKAGSTPVAIDGQASKPQPESDRWQIAMKVLFWILRVLGSGLLIGLGGPFWFNIVQSLMSMINGGAVAATAKPAKPQAAATSAATTADPNADLKNSFNSMQKAEQILAGPRTSTQPDSGAG